MTASVLSRSITRAVPVAWGRDGLTQFFDWSAQNVITTFARKPTDVRRLQNLDALFWQVGSNLNHNKVPVISLLFLMTIPAFRTAAMIAFAGNPAGMYPMARSVLEYAGYALLMKSDPKVQDVWLRRGESPAAKKACKSAFTVAAVKAAIQARDRRLSAMFEKLYERTVDFGGHPNEQALMQNLQITRQGGDGDDLYMKVMQLQGDGLPMDHALRTLAQVGFCVLHVYQWTMPERFSLLGVRDELIRLRSPKL